MKKIYCISGLGADHRVFQRLQVDGHQLVPVPWVPFGKKDTVSIYAHKLAASIPDKDPVIIGVSFGGMLAMEMAKQQLARQVFLVSSAKSREELGDPGGFLIWLFRSGIIPAWLFTIPNKILLGRFGAETAEEKKMVTDIVREADGHFMKWALKAMTYWENDDRPANVLHIHGTADKIIPPAHVHPDFWIKGGSHIMVYNRAEDVSGIIADYL